MPSKTIIAIIAIAVILIIAMFKDINGALLSAGIAIIAGLSGYIAGKVKKP